MNVSRSQHQSNSILSQARSIPVHRGMAFGVILLVALVAFELFNYSTTDFALGDVLGDLRFLGLRWSTILALAFCGIDFAGIARLFSPGRGSEPTAVWYLFGAWILAATMNTILTWWGVSVAISNHTMQSISVIERGTMLTVVPIFVAVMVWLIRILIIGSLSYNAEHLFSPGDQPGLAVTPRTSAGVPSANSLHPAVAHLTGRPAAGNPAASTTPASAPLTGIPSRPAPKPAPRPETAFPRPEPTYHQVSMRGQSNQPR